MDLNLVAQVFASNASVTGKVIDAIILYLKFSPYWAPPILALLFYRAWFKYITMRFIAAQEMVVLEMKLPPEIFKTPSAMKTVLEGLHIPSGQSTFYDRMWLGKVRLWYSFEIVSIEGQVHFYIWVRKAFRRHLERIFYAQYSQLEFSEVPDYTLNENITLDTHNWVAIDYELKQPDPLPIRTYVDLGLDATMTKEEQKVDPLTNIIEFAGSMGKGEQLWIQILAQPQKKEDVTYGGSKSLRTSRTLEKSAEALITKIRSNPEETILFSDGKIGRTMSQKQLEQVKNIHRTVLGGSTYDSGVRALYVAENEHFDGTNVPAMIRMFVPFSAPGSNQLAPNFDRWTMKFDFAWQDFNSLRENKEKIRSLEAYRRRSWFHHPFHFKAFGLTTEELATLYHPLGSVAQTPTMQRISSTRSEAPPNLPV